MSERDQSPAGTRPDGTPDRPADWREQTTPGIDPVGGQPSSGVGATAVGGAAGGGAVGSGAHGYAGSGENYYTTPQYSTAPVTIRRPDALAGVLLVLAGLAAAASLFLDWVRGADSDGLDLVRRGFDELGQGFGTLADSGFWQPLAVVLGGGVLLVLGLLMFVRARTHRTLGVLALLVSGLVIAAVLVVLNSLDWQAADIGIGLWLAVAVAVLGFLGALKAMLTGVKYAAR
ncbi:hypothetical protein [Blastococcus sp. SYSU D00820]